MGIVDPMPQVSFQLQTAHIHQQVVPVNDIVSIGNNDTTAVAPVEALCDHEE